MTKKKNIKKNILLIYADQWRHDQFGSPVSYTPNIDNLARQGTIFEQHYTQVLPCSPSRASLYTGLYAQTHRVKCNKTPLNNRHKTLGHYLRDCGYRPTLFGYTDTILDPTNMHPNDPSAQGGYEILPGFEDGCHQPDSHPYRWMAHVRKTTPNFDFDSGNPRTIYRPDKTRPNGNGGVAGYPTHYAKQNSDTAFLTDALMGWQREQQQGWCAMMCFLRPHNPTVASEPYNSLVDPATLQLPIENKQVKQQSQVHDFIKYQLENSDAQKSCHRDLSGKIADVSDTDKQSMRAVHLGLMAEIDDNLGRVFQQLKNLKQWDDTLILFSSDHGEMMFDYNLCNQTSFYDPSIHVPLIFKAPADMANGVVNNKVQAFSEAVDTIPTVLDCLGAHIPEVLDGRSLLPFIQGQNVSQWRDSVRWEIYFESAADTAVGKAYNLTPRDCMMSVIKDSKFKHVFMPKMPPVLFDLTADPQQTKNVAGDLEYRDIERQYMQKQLTNYITHLDRSMKTHRKK